MIIIEAIELLMRKLARGIYWVITARDCEHCYWHDYSCYYDSGCENPKITFHKCTNTISRIGFVRKKKED